MTKFLSRCPEKGLGRGGGGCTWFFHMSGERQERAAQEILQLIKACSVSIFCYLDDHGPGTCEPEAHAPICCLCLTINQASPFKGRWPPETHQISACIAKLSQQRVFQLSPQSLALSVGGSSSCKLLFVVALIRELHSRGHRTLVFSQSKVMLDILGAELRGMQLRFLRIDGSLSAEQREVGRTNPKEA